MNKDCTTTHSIQQTKPDTWTHALFCLSIFTFYPCAACASPPHKYVKANSLSMALLSGDVGLQQGPKTKACVPKPFCTWGKSPAHP